MKVEDTRTLIQFPKLKYNRKLQIFTVLRDSKNNYESNSTVLGSVIKVFFLTEDINFTPLSFAKTKNL